MLLATGWKDYELLDAGNGEKLERWGKVLLQRPDPQAIWPAPLWQKPHARYIRSNTGGGVWRTFADTGKRWKIRYPGISGEMTLIAEPTGFKHTGIFPEQAINWDFMGQRIMAAKSEGRTIRILNLFAYTGAATVACAMAGADEVVHVDASKGMNQRAKENIAISGLKECYVRFITDDVNKFVEKEIRRGRQYQGIIMDPPSYGRGPSGELWKLEDALYEIVQKCTLLLSDSALFFIINSYTTGLAPTVLSNVLTLTVGAQSGGIAFSDEIGIRATNRPIVLPCGCTGRWQP